MDRVEIAVKKIDELLEAIKREHQKPFTGYAGSASEVLQIIRQVLVA